MNKMLCLFFALGLWSCQTNQQPISRIAFGSCSMNDSTQMWSEVVKQNPDLWIWLGDMIYADTHDMNVMRSKYDQQKNDKDYQSLIKGCPVIGTWDDHDYGINDGGKFYSRKEESKVEMLSFLGTPSDDPVRQHEGVYNSHVYGTGLKKIKVILLDTRSFRDTTIRSTTPGHRFDPNPDGDILGETQWLWLENEIKNSDAAIHIIGSSIQFISNDHWYEKWGNFPKARQRMIDLLLRYKIRQPIFISGDRHMAEISKMDVPGLPDPLYDFTSSGLTHTWGSKSSTEQNSYRVSKLVIEKNFGMILVDWSKQKPTITLEVLGHHEGPYETMKIN